MTSDTDSKREKLPDPSEPVESQATMVPKMVRTGIDLSWLFEPVLLKRIIASPDEKAKADMMIGLARVATARGLDRRPDVRVAVQAADTLVLAEAARRSLIDSIVLPDAEVAARIMRDPGRYDEYRLSHIFIAVGATPSGGTRSEAEAQALAGRLRARIAAGEPFASVARSASEDRDTAAEGGSLSNLLGATMNPAFFPAVQTLSVLATTGPVRGPTGYHLIRLDERRSADVASARFWVEQDVIGERLPKLIVDAIAGADACGNARAECAKSSASVGKCPPQ